MTERTATVAKEVFLHQWCRGEVADEAGEPDGRVPVGDPGDCDLARRKILALSRWIDGGPTYAGLAPETALWRRISKISVEANEALDALGGAVGENRRKGFTNGWDEVDYEILDAALAALAALAHRHGNDCDPIALLFEHIDKVYARAGLIPVDPSDRNDRRAER